MMVWEQFLGIAHLRNPGHIGVSHFPSQWTCWWSAPVGALVVLFGTMSGYLSHENSLQICLLYADVGFSVGLL